MPNEYEVETTVDAVDQALLDAEAKARGLTSEQVAQEKLAQGLARVEAFFADPDRPSAGLRRH